MAKSSSIFFKSLILKDLFLKNLDHRILVFGGIADSKLIKKLLYLTTLNCSLGIFFCKILFGSGRSMLSKMKIIIEITANIIIALINSLISPLDKLLLVFL